MGRVKSLIHPGMMDAEINKTEKCLQTLTSTEPSAAHALRKKRDFLD
jgi:hypothetical protein